jgi:GntR family transcriptional repressor for pyruvate dehydrogenase complex
MKLSDRVVDALQRAIVRGDYPPGTRLPTESELCAGMGVSRSVIRDALRTLSSMGLIAVRQGHGIFVTPPHDGQMVWALALRFHRSDLTMGEVMEARRVIEGAIAAEAAIVCTTDDLTQIRSLFEEFKEAVENARWEDAHISHSNFHLAILKALHLPALELMLHPLQEFILGSSLPPDTAPGDLWDVAAHEPIVTALEAGNPELARAAMRAHFDYIDRPDYVEFKKLLFREAAPLPQLQPERTPESLLIADRL